MQFTYTGNNPNFLDQSFFDQNGVLSVEVTSVTPTEIVLTHTVFTSADVFVTLKGSGFATDAFDNFVSGQITSIEFNGLNIRQATVTDINWSAVAFQDAFFDVADFGDVTALVELFNESDRITIDASNGLSAFDQESTWANFLPLITQPITFVGSRFDDAVRGSAQDDVINTGSSTEDGDRVVGSLGNDQIIFDIPDGTEGAGFSLDYDFVDAGMTFDINGVTNAASASGPGFEDTFVNVGDALSSFLGIEGSVFNDTYSVVLDSDQSFSFLGGRGSDTYNLDAAPDAIVGLDFNFVNATNGVTIDFSTGIIADDGFGFAETLDIIGMPDFIQLFATNAPDTVTDGPGDQLFRLFDGDDLVNSANFGNDSIDGGNGTDRVIFDGIGQGDVTLTFEGSIATLTDRLDPDNSTAMLRVEFMETTGGVALELAKHDGIGTIGAEDLTALTELYIAYFNRAADALGLSFWATAFSDNGFSLREIADLFFTQPETQALYNGVSDGDFVQAVYNNVFGRNADQAGFDFWTAQLAAGNVTESEFIFQFLDGARADTGSPADVAYIENKTDIGLYFAVIQGQNNLDAANAVMSAFDGSIGSINDAIALSDSSLSTALESSTELLMPVVGVVDSPFEVI